MTISVKQLAHAVNTCTRIIPVLVRPVTVCGEESWLLSVPYGDSVKMLFPRHYYTHENAVTEFCNRNDIDRQNVIIKVEEE